MNSFYFGVLCQLLVTLLQFSYGGELTVHPELNLTTSYEDQGETASKLQATDHKLANDSLPVWTVDGNGTLHRIDNVMKKISPFDMYQDPVTSAATIVFTIQMDSDENHRSDDDQYGDSVEERDVDYMSSSINEDSTSELLLGTSSNNESGAPVSPDFTTKGDNSLNRKSATRIQRTTQNSVFLEVLVIVNYDLARKLQTRSNDYPSIVMYVLTLFNNVDVLFAKLKDPMVKINLAGIIIVDSNEPFPLHGGGKCCEQIKNYRGKFVDNIDAHCANEFLRNFCHEHEEIIPPGTYDIVVLLTRYGLHTNRKSSTDGGRNFTRVKGLAESPKDHYYELTKLGAMPTLVATVSDRGEYETFPVLAHEIAYLIGVDHNETIDEMCRPPYPNEKHSVNSLSWSPKSVDSMKEFFSSRNSCMFKNEPGSLQPQGPHKIWNADQQCQCYGYRSAKPSISNDVAKNIEINCREKIECDDQNGIIVTGPIFMDGTPCGDKKICWAKKCVDIIS